LLWRQLPAKSAAEHADQAFLEDKAPPPGLANTVYRNDGQPEPIPGSPAPAWAPLAVAWENVKSKSGLSLALVPWTGMEALPDLLVARAGAAPAVARNLGNGHHWLALQLGGHWRVKPELMRTNSHAIGTRVIVEGQGIHVSYDHTTADSALAQSIGPVVVGLGKQETADLVHLRWPDGVLQCELNVPIDDKRVLAENNRKTGSCPVLFTWNGTRFVCLGDFLGGGGLGYLVAPGAEGRVRGGTGRGADPPHPPLRGTFSRREKGFCPSPAG